MSFKWHKNDIVSLVPMSPRKKDGKIIPAVAATFPQRNQRNKRNKLPGRLKEMHARRYKKKRKTNGIANFSFKKIKINSWLLFFILKLEKKFIKGRRKTRHRFVHWFFSSTSIEKCWPSMCSWNRMDGRRIRQFKRKPKYELCWGNCELHSCRLGFSMAPIHRADSVH